MTHVTTPSLAPIFAIDGDNDDLDLLRIFLRKARIPNPLEVFREGEKALHALGQIAQNSLKTLRPLLCFLDVKTPEINGHEILRWIRSNAALDAMPVVMLTASAEAVDVRKAA